MAQTTKRKHCDPISLLQLFNVRDMTINCAKFEQNLDSTIFWRELPVKEGKKNNWKSLIIRRALLNMQSRDHFGLRSKYSKSPAISARALSAICTRPFEGILRRETDRYKRFEFISMPSRKRQPSKRKAEEPVEANIDKKKENRGERILSLEHCSLVVNSLPSFRFKGCMQLSALQIYVRLKRTL